MAEFAERFPEAYAAWARGDDLPRVAGRRVGRRRRGPDRAGPAECLGALAAGETGIVVTHGACLKVGAGRAARLARASSPPLRGVDNCGWVGRRARARRPAAAGGLQPGTAGPSTRASRPVRPGCPRWPVGPISHPSPRLAKIPELPGTHGWRGCGAAGSAPPWHGGGQGFESPQLHREWSSRTARCAMTRGSFLASFVRPGSVLAIRSPAQPDQRESVDPATAARSRSAMPSPP